jgi:hypothetical protein
MGVDPRTAGNFLRLLEALRTGGGPVLTAQSVDLLCTIKLGDFEPFMPGWKWPLGWGAPAIIFKPSGGRLSYKCWQRSKTPRGRVASTLER